MQEAGVTVQQYMDTWLKQINYPVVDIVLKQNDNGATVEFYQNKFFPIKSKYSSLSSVWPPSSDGSPKVGFILNWLNI